MGDNFIQEAIGNGSVIISMKIGNHEIKGVLHEVHVQSLVKNIFLVNIATTQGLKIEFEQDGYNIKNSVGEVLVKAIHEKKLYKLLCSWVLKSVQIAKYLESASAQVTRKRKTI
jgi:hypothetical protein